MARKPPTAAWSGCWNDPVSGVMRHADAGYDVAVACARAHNLDLPSLEM